LVLFDLTVVDDDSLGGLGAITEDEEAAGAATEGEAL
jgi:hypothetical protein